LARRQGQHALLDSPRAGAKVVTRKACGGGAARIMISALELKKLLGLDLSLKTCTGPQSQTQRLQKPSNKSTAKPLQATPMTRLETA
jgi:hypothetical protein